jgi:hypothetical protein
MMIISKGDPQPFPELRGKLGAIRYPAYVEPKIDGELNWFRPEGKDAEGFPTRPYLINKSGKIRKSCPEAPFPVLEELADIDRPLLGELHWGDGKSGDLYEFLKHQTDDELRFTVFDVDMPGMSYEYRRKWLEENIKDTAHVKLIGNDRIADEAEVKLAYHYITNAGYEGIVVKSADSRLILGVSPWVKMKHRETRSCIIVDISPVQERISVLTDGKHEVGVKVPNIVKRTLNIGDIVEIEHQGVLSKGGLRHPVYIRKVGEK